MALPKDQYEQLQEFFDISDFANSGGFITDLDGTAIHEYRGVYSIPQTIEIGLRRIYDLGRPVVLNTLRFPLSVMRTFGKDWYNISNSPIPTVLMNGSQLGFIESTETGEFGYAEIEAFPLKTEEINQVMEKINHLIGDGVMDLLVFYYPRNWKDGEIIWTPVKEKIQLVQRKYLSASTVYSGEPALLSDQLHKQDICMIFLLIEIPQDKLMAYQHTRKSNFFTQAGVDKKFGAEQIAGKLSFDLIHSVGAGDSEMDTFLNIVGQPIHVGNPGLSFKGLLPPIKLTGSQELGDLLLALANMQRTVIK